MESRPLTKEAFAFRLGRAIDAKKAAEAALGRVYGINAVSRAIDPDDPKRTRRSLQRYLNASVLPRRETRELLARELGLPGDYFEFADDPLYDALRRLDDVARKLDALTWMVQHGTKEMAAA